MLTKPHFGLQSGKARTKNKGFRPSALGGLESPRNHIYIPVSLPAPLKLSQVFVARAKGVTCPAPSVVLVGSRSTALSLARRRACRWMLIYHSRVCFVFVNFGDIIESLKRDIDTDLRSAGEPSYTANFYRQDDLAYLRVQNPSAC